MALGRLPHQALPRHTANSVTITTIHSAKVLDFACVFLLGLDALEMDQRWTEQQIDGLAYVGITRAHYQLFIPHQKETALIARLKQSITV